MNLVTRTADDEPLYSLTAMGGYTPIVNGRWLTQYDATTSKRFGAQKRLGVAFGGSYDYNGRGYNDIEPSPGTNDFGDGRGFVPVYSGIHLREYAFRRHRYGFAGGVDYRLSKGSSAYVRGLFSEFKDFGDTWNVRLSARRQPGHRRNEGPWPTRVALQLDFDPNLADVGPAFLAGKESVTEQTLGALKIARFGQIPASARLRISSKIKLEGASARFGYFSRTCTLSLAGFAKRLIAWSAPK